MQCFRCGELSGEETKGAQKPVSGVTRDAQDLHVDEPEKFHRILDLLR